MDGEPLYQALITELGLQGVRLVPKAGVWHQRLIHGLLELVTFGAQRRYLDGYVTTIGQSIYLPRDWQERPALDRYITLRHERIHIGQFRRYGLLLMAVAYLLLPLPFGLAWCRAAIEREAYEESVRIAFALGGRAATDRMREQVVAQFVSGAYGWMWPFPRAVGRWYDRLVEELETG